MVFEWVKLGFETGNTTIKWEAQKLAVNMMQQKWKAIEQDVIVELNDSSENSDE